MKNTLFLRSRLKRQLACLSMLINFWVPAQTCYAEINEYDIEIVIFEDVSKRYINSEQWPRLEYQLLSEELDTTGGINTNNNQIAEVAESTANDVINITNSDTAMLNEYAKILNASSRYNVLVHKAWRQAGLDAKSAINIHINSKEDIATDTSTTLTGFNPEMENEKSKASSSISGEIRVILGRYLHIYTDLIYKQPNKSYTPVLASTQNDQFKEFSIQSHRRMRSKELHYIDHPLVGVLVMVLPVEKSKEKASQEQATQ